MNINLIKKALTYCSVLNMLNGSIYSTKYRILKNDHAVKVFHGDNLVISIVKYDDRKSPETEIVFDEEGFMMFSSVSDDIIINGEIISYLSDEELFQKSLIQPGVNEITFFSEINNFMRTNDIYYIALYHPELTEEKLCDIKDIVEQSSTEP